MTTTVSGTTVKRDQIVGSPGLDRILGNSGLNRIMSSRSSDRLIYNTGLDHDRIHNRSVRGRITDNLILVVLRRGDRIAHSSDRYRIKNRHYGLSYP